MKFGNDVDDIEYNRLFKFGAFVSSRSGAGPIDLKNSLQNGG